MAGSRSRRPARGSAKHPRGPKPARRCPTGRGGPCRGRARRSGPSARWSAPYVQLQSERKMFHRERPGRHASGGRQKGCVRRGRAKARAVKRMVDPLPAECRRRQVANLMNGCPQTGGRGLGGDAAHRKGRGSHGRPRRAEQGAGQKDARARRSNAKGSAHRGRNRRQQEPVC